MFCLTKESKEFSLLTLLDSYNYEQRAKKVVPDSPGLVDFAICLQQAKRA